MTVPMPPLPAGWQQSRLRFVAAINPSKTEISHLDPSTEVSFVPMEAVGEDASLDASRLKPVSEVSSGYTYFRDGDILIAKITPCFENGKATLARGLTGGFGFGSTEFHVVRPSPRLDARFAFYVIRSNAFREYGAASMYGAGGQKRVPTDFIADYPVALPTLSDQRAIADFLDRETNKIDALIAKQDELIARIKEKQRSEVSLAVSSGNPIRVKNAAIFITSGPRGWSDFIADDGEYFVQSGDLNHDLGLILDTAKRVRPPAGAEKTRATLSNDDAVVCITGANTGRVAHVKTLPDRAYINQHLSIIRPNPKKAIGRYIAYSLYSARGRSYFDECQYGLKEGLNLSDVANAPLMLPDLDEQRRVVSLLDEQQERFEALKSKVIETINLLREHRSALITAAVTGQVDVCVALTEPAIAANDNRQAFRVVVGAEIVSRQGSAKNFGRVKLQKLIYLAEVHAGIHELAGIYVRQAAGPLAPDLLSETERGMEAAGFYRTVPPMNETDGYTYSRIGKAGAHGDQFAAMLGDRAATLTQLIDRFKDYDTRQVEAITTLYAVWNDALIDGETPTDDRIIRGVLEEWHPEKKDKFTATDLKTWLAWMRRNGVVPTGTGSRTQLDRLFV